MLDQLSEAGYSVIGVGKIRDIFAGKGITEFVTTSGNEDGIEKTLSYLEKEFDGLCFVNLVDFDMVYGHRRNIDGYADAATRFDKGLTELLGKLRPEDLVLITADHGCDPGYTTTTDPTREYVPLLITGAPVRPGVDLGTRLSFASIARTVCDYLDVETPLTTGASLWPEIRR